MKIRLNTDIKQYKEKPQGPEVGKIKNRIGVPEAVEEITPEELMAKIEEGRSFNPAVLSGRNADSWQSQQLICADIDNDKDLLDANGKKVLDETGHVKKQPLANPLTPARALDVMARYGIKPYFMYHSFSSSESCEKYRIVIVLDKPLTDKSAVRAYTRNLAGLFNAAEPESADKTAETSERLFFGSRPGSVFYKSGEVTTEEKLKALPAPQEPEKVKHEVQKDMPVYDVHKVVNTSKPQKIQPLKTLQAQFEYAKADYPLAKYIEETEPQSRPIRRGGNLFFNPCPICHHNDCFQVTNNMYHCFSSDDGSGGTIIDFLMAKYNLDVGEACDKFKYEIIGMDKAEWDAAYRESIQEKNSASGASQTDFMTTHNEKPAEGSRDASGDAQSPVQTENEPPVDALDQFFESIDSEKFRPYSTELRFFDNLIGGGLMRQTLTLILAAPGAGKTTLCQQIAEAMAKHKKPVVYLNLEMSRDQMLAKALSARIFRRTGKKMTMLDILQGYRWDDEQREQIKTELERYRTEIYPYLAYNPAGVNNSLESIQAYLESIGKYSQEHNQEAPVVFLDYLHLVTSSQKIDLQELLKQAVYTLKNYAIKYNTCAVTICASNRESNKSGQLTMESARDSSNLEYTADVQISLNYWELDQGIKKTYAGGKTEPTAKQITRLAREPWRRMVLRVLKGRFVGAGMIEKTYFHTASNTFFAEDDFMPADPERQPFQEWFDQEPEADEEELQDREKLFGKGSGKKLKKR